MTAPDGFLAATIVGTVLLGLVLLILVVLAGRR